MFPIHTFSLENKILQFENCRSRKLITSILSTPTEFWIPTTLADPACAWMFWRLRKQNTSFIERLNLTIRRNTAYLHRQTPAHACRQETLAAQLDLQRCFYNFMRPHLALKFGNQIWTPAMMAGITKWKLTWRDVLSHYFLAIMLALLADRDVQDNRVQAAAWTLILHWTTEAPISSAIHRTQNQ